MLQRERQEIFRHSWQPLCHAGKVARPGDVVAGEIAGEPVVITRGLDGVLRAFSNVCRHRASLIAEGECQDRRSLRCPYHNWVYGLDGQLLAAPEFEGVEDWSLAAVCLPQFAVGEWGPFVFVNVDGTAPPLADVMGDIPVQVADIGCDVANLHFSYRRDYVIACNWKVYVDNYLEGYHLPAAHPSLFRELDYAAYRVDTFRYYSSQHAPIRPGSPATANRRYTQDAGRALYFWVFPNLMLNVYPDNLSSNLIVPLSHDRTLTIFEWFTYPTAGGTADIPPETVSFSDEIQQEDIRICESVQKGLASTTYDRGRYSVKRETVSITSICCWMNSSAPPPRTHLRMRWSAALHCPVAVCDGSEHSTRQLRTNPYWAIFGKALSC